VLLLHVKCELTGCNVFAWWLLVLIPACCDMQLFSDHMSAFFHDSDSVSVVCIILGRHFLLFWRHCINLLRL